MNLVQRPEDDQGSIAKLIQRLEDSDAMTEVVVGRSRLITLKSPLIKPDTTVTPTIAVGDPTVAEFDVLPNGRMIRVLGRRVGVTDLSVVTADGEAYTFEIRVVYDLNLLRAYLKQLFPNSDLKLVQMYEHVVVEGQTHSVTESQKIVQTMKSFLRSSQVSRSVEAETPTVRPALPSKSSSPSPKSEQPQQGNDGSNDEPQVEGGIDPKPDIEASLAEPQIINLIRVPGAQQVMLKVKVVEVNKTALRRVGTSMIYRDSSNRTFGSLMGSSRSASGSGSNNGNANFLNLVLGSAATSFAVLPSTDFAAIFDALRSNQVIKVLAEPNLMALHGQEASFLAGGEFPVPVPQGGGGTNNNTITIQFKEFGVLLNFTPFIMSDDSIRLKVAPEVSRISDVIGITTGGLDVPGVETRRANTTVQLKQGHTLALAGLMEAKLEAETSRLPGLGDLPYLGPFFSNTEHERVEKELVILVTPYFVDAMQPDQVGMLPGDDIRDPDDYEFYALNRIESRNPRVKYRATNGWDDPLRIRKTKKKPAGGRIIGVHGFSR